MSSSTQRSGSSSRNRSSARSRSSSQRPAAARPAERAVPGVQAHPEASGPLVDLEADRRRNRRFPPMASAIGAVVVGLIFGLIAAIISVVSGIAVAVVVAVGLYIALRRLAPAGVARSIGATALEPGQLPRVETLLSGLSVTMGVATPSVAVLVDEVPNAAIISTKTGPTAVLTTGLVSALSVVELEGVLAHLLALQRLEAVERGTSGGGLALLLGALGRRGAVSHRLIGQGRLLKADEVAALAVRYPPGLAAALQAMEAAGAPAPSSLFSSPVYDTLRWLFVDPSIGRRSAAEAIGDVDATEVRRRVLAER